MDAVDSHAYLNSCLRPSWHSLRAIFNLPHGPFGTTFGITYILVSLIAPLVSFHDPFGTILEALEQKSQVVEFTMEFDTFPGSQNGVFLHLFVALASASYFNIAFRHASFLEAVFVSVFGQA